MKFDFPIESVEYEFELKGDCKIDITINERAVTGNVIHGHLLKGHNALKINFTKSDPTDTESYATLKQFKVNDGDFLDQVKAIEYTIDQTKHNDANDKIENNLYFGYIGSMEIILEQTNDPLRKAAWTIADKEFEYTKWPIKGNKHRSKDFETTNLRDLKFSNNGKKVFLYDQAGSNHSIKQYTLLSPFDISNHTLVTTYTGSDSKTLKVLVGNTNKTNGLAFSSDGSKMYVTNNTKITEFTLSNSFDLSDVTFEGRKNVSDQVLKISGITFNNDGSKMFIVDFTSTSTSDIHEYNVTCGFGVVKCLSLIHI